MNNVQFYWLYIINAFIILTLIILLIRINFKLQLSRAGFNSLKQNFNELYQAYNDQEKEKINSIQQNAHQKSQIESLNQILQNNEKVKQEYFDLTKASLFELGSELSKQLINIHKQENHEIRSISEKNLEEKSAKFNAEFERVINLIGALSRDVEQSKTNADSIKQALLSPQGVGRLAEITLENILKSSGLRANLDYNIQYTVISENNKFRPDAIVYLPGSNIMVIDSKASKFLYENAVEEDLAKTMNIHLKSLSSKDYASLVREMMNKDKSINYNITTLMFLPTEQAVEKIADSDKSFINNAWAMNIFPVGPIGLMNMLSFAKFQITDTLRQENHLHIIEEVKKLLNSIGNLLEYSQKIGNNIYSLAQNYDKFAASFNRNFLSQTSKLFDLGINSTSKKSWLPLKRHHIIESKNHLIDAEILQIDDLKESIRNMELNDEDIN